MVSVRRNKVVISRSCGAVYLVTWANKYWLKRSAAAREIWRISSRVTADAINIRCWRICNLSSLCPHIASSGGGGKQQRRRQEQAVIIISSSSSQGGNVALTLSGKICHRYDTHTHTHEMSHQNVADRLGLAYRY